MRYCRAVLLSSARAPATAAIEWLISALRAMWKARSCSTMQRGLVSFADLQCVMLSCSSRLRSAWQRGVTSKPLQCVVLMASRRRAVAGDGGDRSLDLGVARGGELALPLGLHAFDRSGGEGVLARANFCARSAVQRGVRERGDLQCVRLIASSHLRTAATRAIESEASAFW